MLRSSLSRGALRSLSRPTATTTAARQLVADYSTVPPPSGSPAPNPHKANQKPDNTMLYTVLGLGAAAGAYIYLKNREDVQAVKDDARAERNKLENKGRESVDRAKAQAGDALRAGERKFDQVKEGSQERMEAARARADNAARNFEARGKSFGEDVEHKVDAVKASAADRLHRAQDSTENLYREAKDSVSRKSTELREEADRKAGDAKETWSSWVGWGKKKTDEGVDKATNESESLKRDGARKVANTAEDVRMRAEKHA